MNFEQFDKLARTDRVTLLTALELLLQNGRRMIQPEDMSALVAKCVPSLGGFFTEKKICEVAAVCKELAALETAQLADYICRGNLKITDPDAYVEGICPVCGGELEYGEDTPLDSGGVYEWACPDCGATGKEGYDKVFDKHYDVHDREGNPYPAPIK